MNIYAEFDRSSRTYIFDEPIKVIFKSKIETGVRVKDISILCYGVLTQNENFHFYSKFDVGVPKENGQIFWSWNAPTDKISHFVDHRFEHVLYFTVPSDIDAPESFRGNHISCDYSIEFTVKTGLFSSETFWFPFKMILKESPVKPSGPPINEIIEICDKDPELPPVSFQASVYLKTPIISNRYPITGHVIIHKSADLILFVSSSIIMTESFYSNGKRVSLETEVVKTRISERDPLIGRELPILIEWQRNFMTASQGNKNFSLSFVLRIHIRFEFGQTSTYDVPIILYRDLKM
ncbi:hypothetical protein TVAG_045960 [Trichomonas vaginalis G3]|uniref:Arrestin-like N-terminal domain-containing protein n=1 Tax=Trichomonas vaginalis (strain ATCC PRA-98 / G3) TaxID=412133 RepID=A2DMG7_TRIV3|nr:vacuolar protein sorting-associated protein 26c family [Trichomonas vaginalis G3]EAY18394.1 hypothetical protein TVAG_045960 [Trichomonas vaginalis G3]KAI5530335.1 vacuolar protein sorting-associated protein 26c family [Trichomonas vaginalis G3]|eukprot:XP_001579380.1 hypothetical protein [Trichomonas vaginalis G3]